MRILSRYIFREIVSSAFLGAFLATRDHFPAKAGALFEVLVRSSATPENRPLSVPPGAAAGAAADHSVRRAGRHPDRPGALPSDGEIIAMRAAGVPSRTVIAAGAVLRRAGHRRWPGYASLRLTPLGYCAKHAHL